jgi:hypothetical protein
MSVRQSVGRLLERVGAFFEQPEVARSITVAAQPFTVPDASGINDHHIQGVAAPGLVPGSLPVLFFRTSKGGSSRFSIRVNATPVVQLALSGNEVTQSWHQLVPAGALQPDGNEVVFGVPSGGSVLFSDVVILYRSNKLTVRRSILEPPVATG